jgi:nucleoid DNA-binding protein
MNKTDMIERMAAAAGITKTQAARAVEALISSMTAALKKGQHVTVVGFGSFRTVQRAARTGRNPRSGKAIHIPARRVARFIPGLGLKQAVNRK